MEVGKQEHQDMIILSPPTRDLVLVDQIRIAEIHKVTIHLVEEAVGTAVVLIVQVDILLQEEVLDTCTMSQLHLTIQMDAD